MNKILLSITLSIALAAMAIADVKAPMGVGANVKKSTHKVNFGVIGTADEAMDLGVNSFIFEVKWDDIEPVQGKYEFKSFDELVKKLGSGMTVACVVTGSTLWNTSKEKIDDPKKRKEFMDYAPKDESYPAMAALLVQLAAKYGDKIKYWGAWSYPDDPECWKPAPDPKEYKALVSECKKAWSGVTNGAKLIIGPFGSALEMNEEGRLGKSEFAQALADKEFIKDIGGVSVVVYTRDGESDIDITQIANAVAGKDSGLVQMPGIGIAYAEKDDKGKVVKLDQQGNMVKTFVLGFAGGAGTLYYAGVTDQQDTSDEDSCALASGSSKRPAYGAFKEFVKEFDGLSYEGTVPCLENGVNAFLFKKGATDFIMVTWGDEDFIAQFKEKKTYISVAFQYPDNVKTITVREVGGKKETIKQRNGFASFEISAAPKFVYLPADSIDIAMGQIDRFDPSYEPAWVRPFAGRVIGAAAKKAAQGKAAGKAVKAGKGGRGGKR